MAKTRVPVAGTIGKSITTVASVPTQNLTITQAQLQAIIAAVNASQLAQNPSGLLPTDWTIISSIPKNIVSIAALTANGFLVRNQDGSWRLVPPPPPGQPGMDGEPGADGERGPPGPPGVKGDKGERGAPGEDGPPGEDGAQGPVGPQGATGAGTTGPQGPMGNPGVDGSDGADGDLGPPGPMGAQGVAGSTGALGPMGVPVYLVADPGEDGERGPPGPPGPQGTAGAQGAIGNALYQITFGDDSGDSSDHMPLIDLGISPTWGGFHSFARVTMFTSGGNGDASSSAVYLISARPQIAWNATGGAANAKKWYQQAVTNVWGLYTLDDAETLQKTAIQFTRSGNAVTVADFGNTTDNTAFNFQGTGAGTVGGGWTFTTSARPAAISLKSAVPILSISGTGAPADQRTWELVSDGTHFIIQTVDDAVTTSRDVLRATRAGVVVTGITLGNAADNPTFGFLGTGTVTAGGVIGNTASDANGAFTTVPFYSSAVTPGYAWNETGAAANARVWRAVVNGGVLRFRITDDAGGTAKNWMDVIRTGGAVTTLDFGNATDNPTYNFTGTGTVSIGGVAAISGLAGVNAITIQTAGAGVLYNGTVKPALVMNASGTDYGMVGNDSVGQFWALGHNNNPSAWGTSVLRWGVADVNVLIGQLTINTIGKGLSIATGTNAKIGSGTLSVSGQVTIANTSVTANSSIFLTYTSAGGSTALSYNTVVAGTSFNVNGTASASFSYVIIEKI